MQATAPRVALLVETSKSFGRGILHGINRYVKEHAHWSIYLEPRELGSAPPAWLSKWSGDGVIARISEPRIAEAVLQSGLPTVNVSSAMPDLPFPRVESNPHTQAKIAARHFIERGFRTFAFCGETKQFRNWSDRVAAEYWTVLRGSQGDAVEQHEFFFGAGRSTVWDIEQATVEAWVARLPKPVAILCVNDPTGLRILEACHKTGYLVPEQVVVLGLENDELVCSMADPPLSSLIPNSQLVEYRAAAMLDRMMNGEGPAATIDTVEPIGIVMRLSTDVKAHHDDVVAAAVRFIRLHACDGIDVDDVVHSLKVSRSCLDRRFKAARAVRRMRKSCAKLKQAMQLLAETKLTLAEVAFKVGYEHAEYMGVVFRRELGITPGEYREQCVDSQLGQIPEI